MKEAFSFFWDSISKYRVYYLLMIIAPVLGAFYNPIIYYAAKVMVDLISTKKDVTFADFTQPLLIYLIADITLSLIWRMSAVASWRSEPYVQKGIFVKALGAVLAYPYRFFHNISSSSLISKIKGLFDGYNELWAQLWYGITYWLITSMITILSILLVNSLLGSILLIWALGYIFLNYFFAKRINALSRLQNMAKHEIIAEIGDSLYNVQSIKLFSSKEKECQRLGDKIANDFIPKEIKFLKYYFFKTGIINDFLGIAIMFIMIVVMIELRKHREISIGDFVYVIAMAFQLPGNLWRLMQEFHKLSDRMGDLKSSLSIYEAHQPKAVFANQGVADMILPKIEFKDVCFGYSNEKPVFSKLNLTILAGESVGVVGYTGAGKTTLMNLILKLFVPQQGKIFINELDISTIDGDTLRKKITVIPQDITLFNRTLMENVRFGRMDASDEEVIAACQRAHADEFISALPLGYNSLVGERGIKLSMGQRQRIAIARAILKNAPILILDEATSALDSVTEQYIQDSIHELLKGKTVLAIAHRLSTLKNMDRVVVIHQGQIVEHGTHSQLLAQKESLYAELWRRQYAEHIG